LDDTATIKKGAVKKKIGPVKIDKRIGYFGSNGVLEISHYTKFTNRK
jgi:hypothetical protein